MANGTLVFPESTSVTLISPTLELMVSSTNEQTEHCGDSHCTGFLLAKSENKLELPGMCSISTEYLVAADKKVVTFGLELNWPRWSFL